MNLAQTLIMKSIHEGRDILRLTTTSGTVSIAHCEQRMLPQMIDHLVKGAPHEGGFTPISSPSFLDHLALHLLKTIPDAKIITS